MGRWPSVSLPQPWAGGLRLVPARLWARSYGSESLRSPTVESELRKVQNISLCFSVSNYRAPPQKKQKLEPIPITDQPSEHVYLFNSSSLLSVSLSLYCVSELGVKQDYSLAVSACRMVFDYNFYFPFLGKKKKNKDKEITVPTKMISTYQESCRTSYTSFYCITVSLQDSRSFKGIVFNGRRRAYRVRQRRSHMYSAV